MKILLVIFHADASRGGAERYTIDLTESLRNAGHQVSLAATTFRESALSFRQVELIARGFTRSQRYRSFLSSLDKHLETEKYDIVHAMLPVRQCDLYHPHAGIAANLPSNLATLINPRRGAFAQVERKLLNSQKPPVLLSLSSYIDSAAKTTYPKTDLRIERLFNAVDLKRFDPEKVQPIEKFRPGPKALIIAQDFARKGVAAAIEAIKNTPITLIVVGGDDAGPYQRQAKSLDDRVIFVGATRDPRPYYKSADFFVLPTKHDPCSLVVLEALAMGLPVITTKRNGASDIMAEGKHGYILERGDDLPALCGAMQKIIVPETLESMRNACLELRPALSYQHHLRQLITIYNKVLKSKS